MWPAGSGRMRNRYKDLDKKGQKAVGQGPLCRLFADPNRSVEMHGKMSARRSSGQDGGAGSVGYGEGREAVWILRALRKTSFMDDTF